MHLWKNVKCIRTLPYIFEHFHTLSTLSVPSCIFLHVFLASWTCPNMFELFLIFTYLFCFRTLTTFSKLHHCPKHFRLWQDLSSCSRHVCLFNFRNITNTFPNKFQAFPHIPKHLQCCPEEKAHTLKTSAYFAKRIQPLPQAYKLLQTLQHISTQLQTYPRDSFQTSIFPDFSKSVQIFLNFVTCCSPCPSSYKFLRWTVIQRFPDIPKLFQFFPPTCPNNWKYETNSTVVCFWHLFTLLTHIPDVFKFLPYFPDFVRHSQIAYMFVRLVRLGSGLFRLLSLSQTCARLFKLCQPFQTLLYFQSLCRAVQNCSDLRHNRSHFSQSWRTP